jgi:radical SAM protein with 4Fe4S-binding SPASM domain
MAADSDQLQIIAINLTRRCNLACAHCYLDADALTTPSPDELTTDEVNGLLDQIALHHDDTMVVLTGGEPLIRKDLEAICSHGKQLGLMLVIGSNGALLTERRVVSLKNAGAMGIGISVDSLDASLHDDFRGKPGSWQKTMRGIEHCRKHGLDFQIHFSITERNYNEIEDIVLFARMSGARVVNFFFIICTGRAQSVGDISTDHYESSIKKIIALQQQYDELIIRPRCAPYFKRIAWQMAPDSALNRISGMEGDGCIAGSHYCRVTPEGEVTACPYIEQSVGNIRQQDFHSIWTSAPDFLSLRNPQLNGKCGDCEFRKLCGGCRARPLAAGGQLMDADASCDYAPRNKDVIEPITDFLATELAWSDEAQQKLGRIPGFIRAMVKKRTESYVTDLGEELITVEHMKCLTARRFGGNLPWKRPESGGGGI